MADPLFVNIAERNMKDVVPLYYNMRKSSPTQINSDTIYEGLTAAFTGGNIGPYSNNISKIWNSDVFISGTVKQKEEAADMVKILCMENNFVIDYAKTLYKPVRPKELHNRIAQFTSQKVPAFFEYAKDKTKDQVTPANKSFVNRLAGMIPDPPINTRQVSLAKIDYTLLMHNEKVRCSKEAADLYNYYNRKYRLSINMQDEYSDNLNYLICEIRHKFTETGYGLITVTDMLVQYLYGSEIRYKELLWFCFGHFIVDNLKRKAELHKTKYVECIDCGSWFEIPVTNRRTDRCPPCRTIAGRNRERLKKARKRSSE